MRISVGPTTSLVKPHMDQSLCRQTSATVLKRTAAHVLLGLQQASSHHSWRPRLKPDQIRPSSAQVVDLCSTFLLCFRAVHQRAGEELHRIGRGQPRRTQECQKSLRKTWNLSVMCQGPPAPGPPGPEQELQLITLTYLRKHGLTSFLCAYKVPWCERQQLPWRSL